jgi:nucleoid-associated protein YgaU
VTDNSSNDDGFKIVSVQSQSSTTSKTYKVQSGDCLMGIARKLLGDPDRWHEIANLNGIGLPYTLYPGQEIKVPGK